MSSAVTATDAPAARVSDAYRWTQLVLGIACMVMIANLQYGWTLFVRPINAAHGWSIAAIQVAFSIFIAIALFLCCERSFWQATIIPEGIWVRRTADEVLFTCWPPAPEAL